jgi:hypothetical protein
MIWRRKRCRRPRGPPTRGRTGGAGQLPGLPEADLLVRELGNFQVKPPPQPSDDLLAWREGPHDDLVLAVGVACWLAERWANSWPWGSEDLN